MNQVFNQAHCSQRKSTSADSHKESDFEMFPFWRKLSAIDEKLNRFKIPQNISSHGCLRSHADDLSGHLWPGHWKFLRQCPR
jgi:hypothetical protein